MIIPNTLCPHCGKLEAWTINTPQISFPPTGGDYERAEVDANATCSACQKNISTRVRVDLDSFKLDKIISSPIPKEENLTCYVVAFVEIYSSDLIEVKVLHFAETLADAELLLKSNGKYSRWAAEAEILTLDQTGYKYLNGTLLHSSANQKISYY